MVKVSIIILSYNTRALLLECLQSIRETCGTVSHEVIVLDNASQDDSVSFVVREFPEVKIIENSENVGFSRGNNQAAEMAQGDYLLLLNSDAALREGALQAMVALMEDNPKAGALGGRLVNPDGTFQASHTRFPTLAREFLMLSGLGRFFFGQWYPSHNAEIEKGVQSVDYVEGACLLVRRDIYRALGGLDEGIFMYAEEVDLCYRLKQHGWQVWYQPAAEVLHHGGASSSRKTRREGDLYRSRVYFFRKHYGGLQATCLKGMLFLITSVKWAIHTIVRRLSGGKKGRQVISPSALFQKLAGV